MPLYDYRCPNCDTEFERMVPMSQRHDQICHMCHSDLEKLNKPTPHYVPWQPYFDIGLGAEVTGRDHHRRLMRDNQCVQREPPTKGDTSARRDWCNEQRKLTRR